MEGIQLAAGNLLEPARGVVTLIELEVVTLVLANFTRVKLVKSTHDFAVARCKQGLAWRCWIGLCVDLGLELIMAFSLKLKISKRSL